MNNSKILMEVIDPGHLQEIIEHFSDESYTDSSRAPKELGINKK